MQASLGQQLQFFLLTLIVTLIVTLSGPGPVFAEPRFWQLFSGPRRPTYYDELRDSQGMLRGPYQQLAKRWSGEAQRQIDPTAPSRADQEILLGGNPLGDRIQIHPVPLVLSQEEQRLIQQGAAQRALALKRLFEEVILKGRDESEFGLPKGLIAQICDSQNRQLSLPFLRKIWRGHSAEEIRFFHATDQMRDSHGRWWVNEDNAGSTPGGLADQTAIVDALYQLRVQGKDPRTIQTPNSGMLGWISFFFSRHTAFGDDPFSRQEVLVLDQWRSLHQKGQIAGLKPDAHVLDLESEREAQAFKTLGLLPRESLITLNYSRKDNRRILRKALEQMARRYPKMRALVQHLGKLTARNGPAISGMVQASLTPIILNRFEPEVYPRDVSIALVSAFEFGAQLLVAPGVGLILGSKALLPYIDHLIQIFLREEPQLPTLPTVLLRDRTQMRGLGDQVVLKPAHGAQGKNVYVLPRLNYIDRKIAQLTVGRVLDRNQKLQGNAGESPELWVAQDFLEASRMGDFSIDTRQISLVIGSEVYVYPGSWGRAANAAQGRKTNVSLGAREVPVFTPEGCQALLRRVE